MTTPETEPLRRRKRTGIWLPIVIGLPILILLGVFYFQLKPEVLSPEEILAKKEWTDRELTDALARSMSPTMTGQQKRNVHKHLSRQLKKRSREQQEKIRCEAVAATVMTSLKQLRKMPAAEQEKMLTSMRKQAERNYTKLVSSAKERKKLEEQMRTREMQAFSAAVNKVIFSEFTPAEKVKFAPLTKLWIKTMNSMGK